MADRDARLYRSARERYEQCSRSDRENFDRIIRELCDDPALDPPLKVKFDIPPGVVRLYNDRTYWIVYDLYNEWTIGIRMLGTASERPTIWPDQG